MYGLLGYLTALGCLTVPRALGWGARARLLFAVAGSNVALSHAVTDASFGAVRTMPVAMRRNLDAIAGLHLLTASTTLLRGERQAARWALAGVGAYQLLAAGAVRTPTGPVRLQPAAQDASASRP